MIESYHFGEIVINGRRYRGDVKIIAGEVFSGWWRREGHVLAVADIQDILAATPELLVVGTGSQGNMKVDDDLRRHLVSLGTILIEQPTAKAVVTFNDLFKSGRNVAGAFHLTC